MQQNSQLLDSLEFTKSSQFADLKNHLVTSRKSLYEFENDLVAKVESGAL